MEVSVQVTLQQSKNVTMRLLLCDFKGTVHLNLVLHRNVLDLTHICTVRQPDRQLAPSQSDQPHTAQTTLRGGGRTAGDKGEETTGN